ncbi:MAG: TetR/AcrR family transcriptional regulator [Congregibacter sp.]
MENARSRSRARLEERERVILDAATELFASDGFHATSTRKIASAAGVSEGTVFHYFGSKNELMLGILDRFYNGVLNPRAAEILDTVMETRARLYALARHHVHSLAEDNALMMRLLQVYVGVDFELVKDSHESPLRTLNRSYVQYFDRIAREGMQRGELRSDLAVRPLRDLFFGTLEYGLRTHTSGVGQDGLDTYIDQLMEPLWTALAVHQPSANLSERLIERLEKACETVERAAEGLQDKG